MARTDLTIALERYARANGSTLPPQWDVQLRELDLSGGATALERVRTRLDWDQSTVISGRPQPEDFPLLIHDPDTGWAVAYQWVSDDTLALISSREPLAYSDQQTFFAPAIPDPLKGGKPRAFGVFASAIAKRSRVLFIAGIATVFANLLTLATSLYAMQLYDRVIPLASFETLAVLTAGVLFALVLDLVLRSLRAILIEAEAQNIDKEVSAFFFARAQAIRLDSRPQGVGTMAAQIQGQEQIRQVMSSSSLFVLADLPFAILFIGVIAGIGGSVALVPIISLPIALLLAVMLAVNIRKGADRAQVTGNQKNGLLVESLDAAETIKANLGGWQMISRWNRLIRDVHHYEDPVKRVSAISGSLFSSLQQITYVAVMGYGAYLAAIGEITTGGLLACSIIVGRINGPLIAQLPNLIVQWGYARSSLRMLDTLLDYPVERTASAGGLRPSDIAGPITLKDVSFAYAQGSSVLEIDAIGIRPGERVAIIGGVGAGKSTLLKVLGGLYTPQQGSVAIKGYELSQLAEDFLRREVGYLSQNPRLVRGTLRDCLTMGLGHIPDDELVETARGTGLGALFSDRKPGLDIRVEEGGGGLSGGQRALIGLNRLLHLRPHVWLLDEPTSALDMASEKRAFDALEKALRADDILIMATHKLALVERFTRVIVMQHGRIIRDAPASEFRAQLQSAAPKERPGATATGTVTTRIGGSGQS